jgi:tRNA(Arg) A34 adenosine deaminase TadA
MGKISLSTSPDIALAPSIEMPAWLQEIEQENLGKAMPGDEEKILFAIMLAIENVRRGTGGPFGAAIFELGTHRLIATGINLVAGTGQSWAHAEMTAFANAQNRLGRADLKGYLLAASCEPCAMCFGATPWSGVEMLIYGARGEAAQNIGFDEGDKVADWQQSLENRNIKVIGPLPGDRADEPFRLYRELGGVIY